MSQYLGDISAYALAVSQGYTGTEEEYAELMASYATVGQTAVDAKDAALAAKTAAQTAATTATNKASEATTAAQTATTKAQEAVANAEAAARDASQAMAAESMATTKASEATTAAATATTAKDDAVSAKTAAETAQGKAEDAQAAAESVAESIPSDYSQLSEDVSDLKEGLNSIVTKSINLFNPDDPDLVENVELLGSGATQAKTNYFASGFIPIRAGQTICCHYPTGTYGSNSKIVWYNANKERTGYSAVSAENRLTDANGHTYIRWTFGDAPSSTYIRLTGYMPNESFYMYVYADEMPSTYEAYTEDVYLSNEVKVDFANVKNVSVSKSDTDFIKANPKNLVDLSAMVTGVVSNSSSNGDIDTSATNWMSTDYIPVKPNTTYTLYVALGVYYGANNRGIPYYDANKTYLGRVQMNGGASATQILGTITIPNNNRIAYIRTSYPIAQITNHKQWLRTMIVEGDTWVGDAYIPYDDTVNLQGAGLSAEFSTPLNCLFGKMALWNGDSICAADNDPNGGWPITIAKANGMQAKNYGIAGGTIAENTGSNVHSVSATLDSMLSAFPNADYIIIEGGTNDADILGDSGIGTFDADDFTDTYITGLDKNTFSGALESIFYRLVTVMKGKHIGYLIPQKMGHTEVLVTRRRAYFDRAIAICQKWGIPYLDLWNDYYFNWRLSAHWDQSMTSAQNEEAGNLYQDGQHLTTHGYAVESPIIAEWMKTI